MSALKYRQPNSPLGRILTNTVWLLGGKGFGAVCSIVYLAILTRTLGLKGFGHFSLIFGTAQALIAIAGFQTWRVIVNFGAPHVHDEDWDKFGRLSMLGGLLDLIGAVFGCIIAAVAFYGFSHMLELNPAYINIGFAFSCAMLWALVSAPTGIVRALHRFDVSVYVEAVVPIGRMLAAIVIWLTGPSVGRFLFAWALVDLIEAALYWLTARRLCPEAVKLRYITQWRQTLKENPGLARFFLNTYVNSTLDAVMSNGPLLAVGGLIGTKAAGLYRLASQLAQALGKLSTMLTRTVYAEIARARVSYGAKAFRKLALQTSLIATGTGVIVVALAWLAGDSLLQLIGGDAFEKGTTILVPLVIAASFELARVAFEPVLHSTGRVRLTLVSRVVMVVSLVASLFAFIGIGPSGAAWAVAFAGAVGYLVMGGMAWWTLNHIRHENGEAEQPTDLPKPEPGSTVL